MGAPLADYDALDGCSAFKAGLTGAVISAEMVLEVAASVDPVDTGTVVFDARL